MTENTDTLIWTRPIDWEAQAERKRQFLRFYVAPVIAVAVVVAIVSDPMNALGVLILFGMLGLLVGGWVFFKNLTLRQNAELFITASGALKVGTNGRPIDLTDLVSWQTRTGTLQHTQYLPNMPLALRWMKHETEVGILSLRFPAPPDAADGVRARRIMWPGMEPNDLDALRAALTTHLDAPWVETDGTELDA